MSPPRSLAHHAPALLPCPPPAPVLIASKLFCHEAHVCFVQELLAKLGTGEGSKLVAEDIETAEPHRLPGGW